MLFELKSKKRNIIMEIKTYAHKKNNTTSFKALPIAKIQSKVAGMKAKGNEITLYKLSESDMPFLKKMLNKLDLKKLYPNETSYSGFNEWKEIIKYAVNNLEYAHDTILATFKNRPCGIIQTKNKGFNELEVKALATWTTRAGKEQKHVGLSLARQMFESAARSNKSSIILSPSLAEPRGKSCIDFYTKLDFKESGEIYMKLNAFDVDIDEKCQELEKLLEFKYIHEQKNVNLNKKLNLNYYGTKIGSAIRKFKEKIRKN